MDDYCPICGNTRIMLDGSPCSCVISKTVFNSTITMLDIPEQYQGLEFNKSVIDTAMGDAYINILDYLYTKITTMNLRILNYLICSPKQTSKRVLAYSAIQYLFQKGIETFPIYDLLELKRITIDMDLNRKQVYTVEEPEKILNVKYLFVIVPSYLTYEVFQMMSVLTDRRTRRSNCTIYIYDGSYKDLEAADFKGVLKSLKGDGSYGSIKVYDFWRSEQ